MRHFSCDLCGKDLARVRLQVRRPHGGVPRCRHPRPDGSGPRPGPPRGNGRDARRVGRRRSGCTDPVAGWSGDGIRPVPGVPSQVRRRPAGPRPPANRNSARTDRANREPNKASGGRQSGLTSPARLVAFRECPHPINASHTSTSHTATCPLSRRRRPSLRPGSPPRPSPSRSPSHTRARTPGRRVVQLHHGATICHDEEPAIRREA